MFIVAFFNYVRAPAERNVLWFVRLHAAPKGAESLNLTQSYKHLAPPEHFALSAASSGSRELCSPAWIGRGA